MHIHTCRFNAHIICTRTHRVIDTRDQSVGQPSRILVIRDYGGLGSIRKLAGQREKDLASNSGAVHQDYDPVALGSVAIENIIARAASVAI